MATSDRTRDLIQRHLDGLASDAETAELDRALAGDPEAAAAFAEMSRLDSRLDDHFGGSRLPAGLAAGGKPGAPAAGSREAASSGRFRALRHEAPARRAWWIPALAASILVGISLLLTRDAGRKPRPAPVVPAPAAPVANAARAEVERLESERRRIQERLVAVDRERERLAAPGAMPPDAVTLARIESDRRQIEEEMARTVEAMRRANATLARGEPAPVPVPPVAPPASEPPLPARPGETVAAVARLGDVRGQVVVLAAAGESPARDGQGLFPGEGVRTAGPESAARLSFTDGMVLDLGPETTLARVEGPSPGAGRRIAVGRGAVTAAVSRQPAGRPTVFATPHGDAVVLGTRLVLTVAAESTRLEVQEGLVRLKRADGEWADVSAGMFAVAAKDAPLAARPIPPPPALPDPLTVNFGPAGVALPPGVLNDDGAEFDAARGYGWMGPNDLVQTMKDMKEPRRHAAARAGPDPLRASHLGTGTTAAMETWQLRVPNGAYLVTVCVGGTDVEQGPHHVRLEGRLAIEAATTKAGEFIEVKDLPVVVKDGFLTMTVGGSGGRPSFDGSSDTILCFITLRRAPDGGR